MPNILAGDLQFHRDAFVIESPRLSQEEIDRIAAALENSRAANTRKAYRSDWKLFEAWCGVRGQVMLPAAPELVAAYITDLARFLKASTISRRLTAISEAHRAAGLQSPAESAMVRATNAGIRRQIGTASSGKDPLTVPVLTSILPLPDSPKHRRDRALLLIGFAAALRRSELVGLDWSVVKEVREGLVIDLTRSKTDQEGEGRRIPIPYADNPGRCPVRALLIWREDYYFDEGPVFVRIHKSGAYLGRLSDHAVAKIVKRYATAAGLDPKKFSGHSMRAGFATSAAAGGAEERSIMKQTGHRSVAMVRKYIREGELFVNHPLGNTGL